MKHVIDSQGGNHDKEWKEKKKAISCALVAVMSVGLAACGTTSYDFKVSYDGIKTGDVSSKISVHDPSILKADGEYYIFGSHMSAAKSSDLLNWEKVADGYSKKKKSCIRTDI